MRLSIRNLLHAPARDYDAIRPAPDEPAEAAPEVDPRDAQLRQARRELADAQDQIAELEKAVLELTTAFNERTVERDGLAVDLENTKTRLAATHHAHHAKTNASTWTYADPPPASDRSEALREKERADTLAGLLAAAEAELHRIKYPVVRQATNA